MEYYSYSQISMMSECHKKYFIGYGLGIRSKIVPIPMVRGRGFHVGVAKWHSTYDRDLTLEAQLKIVSNMPTFSASEAEDKELLIRNLTVTIMAYTHNYSKDNEEIRFTDIEIPLEVGCGGFTVKFIPDSLGFIGSRDVMVEEKSISQIDKTFVDRIAIDLQSNLYIWLLRQYLERPSYNPLRIFRITKLSSLKRKKSRKTGEFTETEEEFQSRIVKDYYTDPGKYFINEKVEPDEDKIELAANELYRMVESIQNKILECKKCGTYLKDSDFCIKRCGLWYRDTSKCSIRGGCSMLPLCSNYDAKRMFYTQNWNTAKLENIK